MNEMKWLEGTHKQREKKIWDYHMECVICNLCMCVCVCLNCKKVQFKVDLQGTKAVKLYLIKVKL